MGLPQLTSKRWDLSRTSDAGSRSSQDNLMIHFNSNSSQHATTVVPTGFRAGLNNDVYQNPDPTMESGNWKTRLQRKRTVNKIMDTLKRHLPLCGEERLQELKKIAERVEDEVYIAATSQSQYTRKICFMMLTMETRLQSPVSYSASVPYDDSIAQAGNSYDGDWETEVFQKIKYLKELYLRDTRPDWRTELKPDSRERIRIKIMETLKRHLPFSGLEGLEELNKIAVRFEGRIYAAATSQSDYLRKISLKMLSMETRSQNSMPDPVW